MVKKYRLLKDLPFAKAGAIFQEWTTKRNEKEEKALINANNLTTTLWSKDIDNFDEWFEEVKKSKRKYLIDFYQAKVNETLEEFYMDWADNNLTDLMVWFDTREEAEKHLAYLKAKAIIKKDAKGFKPNWQDTDEDKWCGVWDIIHKEVSTHITWYSQEDIIYFKSEKDIKESSENHPKEWKAYLTYEQ